MPYHELTPDQRRRVAEVFQEVIDNAVPANEIGNLGWFEPRDEEFIAREVQRLLHEPLLPWAGIKEQKWARTCRELAADKGFMDTTKAMIAESAWKVVDGHYYNLRPVPAKDKEERSYLETQIGRANMERAWTKKWFYEMLLDGLPVAVANFRLDCRFLLRKPDGDVDRLVELVNNVGEKTGLVALSSEAFHAPTKMRQWCLNQGNYNWGVGNQGGAQELALEKLHADTGRAAAYRTVTQVVSCGWHPLKARADGSDRLTRPGIWFADDGAIADGAWLERDKYGIYWHEGEGYQLSDTGRENEFFQKRPRWLRTETLPPVEDVRDLFVNLADRLRRTVGGMEAYLLIGGVMAYAAAPEVFEELSFFPGLWIHGAPSSGKSTIVEWLMEIPGFHLRNGLGLRSKLVTPVGMLQALDQYSNVPVWVDEFRYGEVDADKVGVLHAGFNRSGDAKFNAAGVQRVKRTAFLVTGESTGNDPALRGRYVHVQVSVEDREKDAAGNVVNHLEWFNAHRDTLHWLWRTVLERREEFVKLVLDGLKGWRELPELAGVNTRDVLVHGVPYAAFRAMVGLLESHGLEELIAFKKFALGFVTDASHTVAEELSINVFWSHLIAAWKAKEIEARCFRVECTTLEHAPGRPNQKNWRSMTLWLDPAAVLESLQLYLRKRDEKLPLRQRDLQAQLSREKYWAPRINGGPHKKRFKFGGNTNPTAAWGIQLDFHPMGYQTSDDEVVEAARTTGSQSEPIDPRFGDLYVIANEIWRKEQE